MTPDLAAIFVLLMVGSFVLLLVLCAAVLRLAERFSPRLTRYLDRHLGPETTWERKR